MKRFSPNERVFVSLPLKMANTDQIVPGIVQGVSGTTVRVLVDNKAILRNRRFVYKIVNGLPVR